MAEELGSAESETDEEGGEEEAGELPQPQGLLQSLPRLLKSHSRRKSGEGVEVRPLGLLLLLSACGSASCLDCRWPPGHRRTAPAAPVAQPSQAPTAPPPPPPRHPQVPGASPKRSSSIDIRGLLSAQLQEMSLGAGTYLVEVDDAGGCGAGLGWALGRLAGLEGSAARCGPGVVWPWRQLAALAAARGRRLCVAAGAWRPAPTHSPPPPAGLVKHVRLFQSASKATATGTSTGGAAPGAAFATSPSVGSPAPGSPPASPTPPAPASPPAAPAAAPAQQDAQQPDAAGAAVQGQAQAQQRAPPPHTNSFSFDKAPGTDAAPEPLAKPARSSATM